MKRDIGEAAGKVWHVLNSNGPMSQKRAYRITGLPQDTVNQGIGWLACEGKVTVEQKKKGSRILRLQE